MPEALVVGSLNMDLTLSLERPPKPGETLLARSSALSPGGKGANQAVAARRLGLEVAMVGRIGEGPIGDAILASLLREGVGTQDVLRSSGMSGMASIALTPDGENAIAVAQGANALLAPEDVEAVPKERFACKVLIAQLEVPQETVLRALARAREMSMTTILNPAPAPRNLQPELLRCDVIVPNEGEATALTGEEDPERAARSLLARGPRAVIVTLGAAGALVATREETHRIPSPKVRAIDTTGAGDSFVGAIAYWVARHGLDPFAAAELGVRVGAQATTRRGAQAAMPKADEMLRAGARM